MRALLHPRRAVSARSAQCPHSPSARHVGLYLARRYEEARAANAEAISLEPDLQGGTMSTRWLAYYAARNFESARVTCENEAELTGYVSGVSR